ncbi:hydrolase [Nocardia sp. Root136]|uniref:alpha/beta fold hydrolase n=1 Tax=Nocardia sp. Root136 TaxID=1736458 RepID=UPI0006F53989|nr:alpha/beta fold hydrolase [Nocardia sp. Root136]KQY31967.1 hydrolase [Nocardia sp. Root136]
MGIVAELPRAVRNVWSVSFGGGLESYRPAPSTTVYDGAHRHLKRYDRATSAKGNPVLLVPPLAVTTACFDLRPGQSLVRYLLDQGRQPYVIDYGEFGYADRDLGLEDWTDDILPEAISRVSEAHDGRGVDIIGWSLGGVLALLTAASHADLPIASITCLAAPIDQARTAFLIPLRLVAKVTGGREMAVATKVMGGIPREFVRLGFRIQAFDRELAKPIYLARNAFDAEALAKMEATDRFMATMPGYPGRSYWQIYRSLVLRNELASGSIRLRSDLVIELSKVTCRVLLAGSRSDVVVPAASVRRGLEVLPNAAEVEFVEVSGGHLSMVSAADTTWPAIEEFLSR